MIKTMSSGTLVLAVVASLSAGRRRLRRRSARRGRPAESRRTGPGASAPGSLHMLDAYALVQAQKALSFSDEQYRGSWRASSRSRTRRRATVQRRNRLMLELRD